MIGKILNGADRALSALVPSTTAAAAQPCVRRCWYQYRCNGLSAERRQVCQFYTCELTYGPWQKVGVC